MGPNTPIQRKLSKFIDDYLDLRSSKVDDILKLTYEA